MASVAAATAATDAQLPVTGGIRDSLDKVLVLHLLSFMNHEWLRVNEVSRRAQAICQSQMKRCVDHLSFATDFPQPVLGIRIAHRYVTATFHSVRDGAPVFAILYPVAIVAVRASLNLRER